ncbi:MAG: RNA polymerase sigma factor [Bacteroidales bacterium]|nr:RNA polymerase sigma factor [Bacteroidales bacterium]
MNTTKDEILKKECLRGDRKSQKKLFDTYKNAMFTLCLRITANEEDAKDALQEGFIAVFNGLHSFKSQSTIGAWIKTIMVRTALRKVRKIWFEDVEEIKNTSVEFDSDFTGEMLHKAIMQLDNGFRTVFVLYEVEGYSHREIAEITGISVGTSKSQLHYAKKKLKSIIVNRYDYER